MKKDKEMSVKDSINFVRKLFQTSKKPLRDLSPGDLITFSYNAKDKTRVFDRTPMVLILGVNSKYVLGINFHWCPLRIRKKLVRGLNTLRDDKTKKLSRINYKKFKILAKSLMVYPIIRLYIKGRMSSRGVLIPTEHLDAAVLIKSETFTGGISAEKLYSLALKGKLGKLKV